MQRVERLARDAARVERDHLLGGQDAVGGGGHVVVLETVNARGEVEEALLGPATQRPHRRVFAADRREKWTGIGNRCRIDVDIDNSSISG